MQAALAGAPRCSLRHSSAAVRHHGVPVVRGIYYTHCLRNTALWYALRLTEQFPAHPARPTHPLSRSTMQQFAKLVTGTWQSGRKAIGGTFDLSLQVVSVHKLNRATGSGNGGAGSAARVATARPAPLDSVRYCRPIDGITIQHDETQDTKGTISMHFRNTSTVCDVMCMRHPISGVYTTRQTSTGTVVDRGTWRQDGMGVTGWWQPPCSSSSR